MTEPNDNLLRHNGYAGSIDVSLEDQCLHGRLLHIDDLITYGGSTVQELKAEFETAVDDYLAYCHEVGKTPNKPYTGSFNVRVGAERHRWLVERASTERCKLNDMLCRTIDKARLLDPAAQLLRSSAVVAPMPRRAEHPGIYITTSRADQMIQLPQEQAGGAPVLVTLQGATAIAFLTPHEQPRRLHS